MIFLEKDTDIELDIDYEKVANLVVDKVLEVEGCPFETEVNILLTDNAAICEINRECRQIDRPTDVLSFPNLFFESEGDYNIAPEELADCIDPETNLVVLGDIIISLEKVIEQAEEYGHSVLREYAFLIAHSMLHLSGYDHMEPDEAERMEAKQKAILDILNITRD